MTNSAELNITKTGLCAGGFKQLGSETYVLNIEWWYYILRVTQAWGDVPPVKNCLQSLCKTIRSHGPEPRVFISNHLPRAASSPLRAMVNANFTLQMAVHSVGQAVGWVFELSMHDHFVSKTGKLLKPVHKYWVDGNQLTCFGCMIFRECMMREAGLKSYWFTARASGE